MMRLSDSKSLQDTSQQHDNIWFSPGWFLLFYLPVLVVVFQVFWDHFQYSDNNLYYSFLTSRKIQIYLLTFFLADVVVCQNGKIHYLTFFFFCLLWPNSVFFWPFESQNPKDFFVFHLLEQILLTAHTFNLEDQNIVICTVITFPTQSCCHSRLNCYICWLCHLLFCLHLYTVSLSDHGSPQLPVLCCSQQYLLHYNHFFSDFSKLLCR